MLTPQKFQSIPLKHVGLERWSISCMHPLAAIPIGKKKPKYSDPLAFPPLNDETILIKHRDQSLKKTNRPFSSNRVEIILFQNMEILSPSKRKYLLSYAEIYWKINTDIYSSKHKCRDLFLTHSDLSGIEESLPSWRSRGLSPRERAWRSLLRSSHWVFPLPPMPSFNSP